jgi:hypothetical protein
MKLCDQCDIEKLDSVKSFIDGSVCSCRPPHPRRGESRSGLEKATRDKNFSAMELHTLTNDLKQQL